MPQRKGSRNPERDEIIRRLRAEGYTVRQLGQAFGVSFQRVHQITRGIKPPAKWSDRPLGAAPGLRVRELHNDRDFVVDAALGKPIEEIRRVWGEAVEKKDLPPIWRVVRQHRDALRWRRKYLPQDVLGALREAARAVGEPLTSKKYEAWRRKAGKPSSIVAVWHYGSWRAACEAAGVRCGARNRPRKDDTEVLLEALSRAVKARPGEEVRLPCRVRWRLRHLYGSLDEAVKEAIDEEGQRSASVA